MSSKLTSITRRHTESESPWTVRFSAPRSFFSSRPNHQSCTQEPSQRKRKPGGLSKRWNQCRKTLQLTAPVVTLLFPKSTGKTRRQHNARCTTCATKITLETVYLACSLPPFAHLSRWPPRTIRFMPWSSYIGLYNGV